MPRPGVQKRRARHKRGSAAYVLLSFILITAAVGLALSLFFKINRIEVSGCTVYAEGDIIAASGILEGDNLLFLNKSAARKNIFEDFPYVAEARLVRRLPGTLVIELTERDALGVIAVENGYWLIDGSGRLLEQVASRTVTEKPFARGLILLSPLAGTDAAVPREQQEQLQALLLILNGLEQHQMLSRVSEVDVTRSHELRLSYEEGRFEVLLGDAMDMDIKLSFLQATIDEMPSSARGALDVAHAAERKRASYIPAPVDTVLARTPLPE